MENETKSEIVTLAEMQDFVEKKAAELKNELAKETNGKNIIPILIPYKEEYIVGYAVEPNRYQKSLALGKMSKSAFLAGTELLDYCLLKKHSDIRLYSEDSKYDAVVFGAAMKMVDTIEVIADECKKK